MDRVNLNGDLPYRCKGILDHKKIEKMYGFLAGESVKARHNWLQIFRKPNSTLTFKQYLDKLIETNITPNQVGATVGHYHLSRDNDQGSYHNRTCRFLPLEQNLRDSFLNGRSRPFRSWKQEQDPIVDTF